jgi:hypothetical protein
MLEVEMLKALCAILLAAALLASCASGPGVRMDAGTRSGGYSSGRIQFSQPF